MRAVQKHSAGQRSKDKYKFDELTENGCETKNEDGSKMASQQRPGFVHCPFLQSSYDVPGQLLLVIAERNSSNYQNRSPSHRLKSESLNSSTDLTSRLGQRNSNLYEKTSSNNQEAVASISPWSRWDYDGEIRRPSVNKTCLSSSARHRQKCRSNALEATIARNRSNQATTGSNIKKRWEYTWTGRRPTDEVAYKFHHYSDISRYMEQYRQDHVHRGTSSPETKNEEPSHSSTLSICSIGAPLEQPNQDPVRPFLIQRLPYNRQTTDLDQQRKRGGGGAKSGVSFLGFRGHLYEEDSTLLMKEDVARTEGGVAGERCISGCRVLHPNSRGVLNCVAATMVISGISLPWCSLRVASRRHSTKTPDFIQTTRKNISDTTSNERSPRVAVLPAARTDRDHCASSRSVTVIDVTAFGVQDLASFDVRATKSEDDRRSASASSLAIFTSKAK